MFPEFINFSNLEDFNILPKIHNQSIFYLKDQTNNKWKRTTC